MAKSAKEACEEAYQEAIKSLSRDVPLLLHGSGDVAPSQVNPATVNLVASLTVQYIAKLVDASLDSHLTFLDYPEVFHVPPPSFPKNRMPSKPPPFSVTHPVTSNKSAAGAQGQGAATGASSATAATISGSKKLEEPDTAASTTTKQKQPYKRLREEYWDDGLPTPKIKSTKHQSTPPTEDQESESQILDEDDWDADKQQQQQQQVPMEEWVGAIGVDFREHQIRKAHVKNAIATPSFVFPICHDVYAYNRVREIRAAKRTLDPLLQDSTINEMVKVEGRRAGVRADAAGRDAKNKKESTADPEDEIPDDAEEGEPEWPGLDYVLPVHVLKNLRF